MKCFYHSADLDGHCSGAIVKLANPDCEMIGMDYGEEFPWGDIEKRTASEKVVMIDFSLQPFDDMVRLARACNLIWIDHHKSAIEEANRLVGVSSAACYLDTTHAACEIAWQHYFEQDIPDMPPPLAVHWLGRYDIWKHAETPGSLEFQYGMRMKRTDPSNPENMHFWKAIFDDDHFAELTRDEGAVLLAYEKMQNEKFMAVYGFETELDGLRCIAANKGMGNSLVFDSMYDPAKHDAMLMFAWKGKSWTVSLYATKPDIDVSVICKDRGGGGHKGAAGFQCAELPFLENKT